MEKWEYRMFNVLVGEVLTTLDRNGVDGWEAFHLETYYQRGALPGSKEFIRIYCKRKI